MPDPDVLPMEVFPTCTVRSSKATISKDHFKTVSLVRRKFKQKKLLCRIDACASMCSDRESVRYIQQISQLFKQKATDAEEVIRGCSLLRKCLVAMPGLSNKADQWLVGEAVTWGLVRFTQSREVVGSAGHVMEELVRVGQAGSDDFEFGESSLMPFLFALGGLFGDIDHCQSLLDAARSQLQAEVKRLVGEEGSVGLKLSSEILGVVNRWVRCREIMNETSGGKLTKETNNRIDEAVVFSVLLLGNSGRPITNRGLGSRDSVAALLQAASGGQKKVAATVLALTEGKDATGESRWTEKGLCSCSIFDQTQGTAVLRSGWKRGATRVLVSYRDEVPYIEIVAGDRQIIAGAWGIRLVCNGNKLQLRGGWRRTWWEMNENASYLEISADVQNGWRLERSVLLLPKDKIVLLSDAVIVPGLKFGDKSDLLADQLQLQSTLSVSPAIDLEPCEETREVFGCDNKPRFLAIPLALDEWRESGAAAGSLNVSDGGLELKQNSHAGRMYAPLWIDCDAGRLKRLKEKPESNQRTWRQLTVADSREALRDDQAVSFRVQANLNQWFVYRSLDEARNRTALGCNMSSEFLVGRIAANGVIKRALEVVEDRVLY